MGLKKIFKGLDIKYGVIISITLAILLSILIPGNYEATEAANLSLAVNGILFGIVVGFYFSDLWLRWQTVRENVANETAALISYLECTKYYRSPINKNWRDKQEALVTKYLMEYFKSEWGEESPAQDAALNDLINSSTEVRLKTDEEVETWSVMIDKLGSIRESYNANSIISKDKLELAEWLVLTVLGFSLLLAVFYLKVSEFSSIIFTILLTSAVLILFFVIRDLNNLSVEEADITFEPYFKIYDFMKKPRAYWRKDVEDGRIKPPADKKYIIYD